MTKKIDVKKSAAPPVLNGTGLQRAFRFKELSFLTGLKRTQLREMIRSGDFPQGVHVSEHCRTRIWFEKQLKEWQSARASAR